MPLATKALSLSSNIDLKPYLKPSHLKTSTCMVKFQKKLVVWSDCKFLTWKRTIFMERFW